MAGKLNKENKKKALEGLTCLNHPLGDEYFCILDFFLQKIPSHLFINTTSAILSEPALA